jgi:hypothetical protein
MVLVTATLVAHEVVSHEATEVREIPLGRRIRGEYAQDFAGAHFTDPVSHHHQRLRTDQAARVQALICVFHAPVVEQGGAMVAKHAGPTQAPRPKQRIRS